MHPHNHLIAFVTTSNAALFYYTVNSIHFIMYDYCTCFRRTCNASFSITCGYKKLRLQATESPRFLTLWTPSWIKFHGHIRTLTISATSTSPACKVESSWVLCSKAPEPLKVRAFGCNFHLSHQLCDHVCDNFSSLGPWLPRKFDRYDSGNLALDMPKSSLSVETSDVFASVQNTNEQDGALAQLTPCLCTNQEDLHISKLISRYCSANEMIEEHLARCFPTSDAVGCTKPSRNSVARRIFCGPQ